MKDKFEKLTNTFQMLQWACSNMSSAYDYLKRADCDTDEDEKLIKEAMQLLEKVVKNHGI